MTMVLVPSGERIPSKVVTTAALEKKPITFSVVVPTWWTSCATIAGISVNPPSDADALVSDHHLGSAGDDVGNLLSAVGMPQLPRAPRPSERPNDGDRR
jgi:hypothetical protein